VINADGEGQRPDMVVRIAGDRNVVVDSKVTLAAFLDAYESVDPAFIEDRLQAHARHLRDHVKNLSATAYWKQFTPAPEFVVLFVPGESFLAPALERDRDLLEFAMSKNVIIATPTTLISMLKTIAYAWQQEKLSQNAQQVLDLGKELYDRLGKLGGHISTLGKSIESVTKNFNNTVSSLESRVLVSARKLNDLEIVGEPLDQPKMVESSVNQLSKAELVEGAQEELSIRLVDEVPAIEPPASSTGA
jgi:DNA recombination protein RmuC